MAGVGLLSQATTRARTARMGGGDNSSPTSRATRRRRGRGRANSWSPGLMLMVVGYPLIRRGRFHLRPRLTGFIGRDSAMSRRGQTQLPLPSPGTTNAVVTLRGRLATILSTDILLARPLTFS
jgi:hypothetical protein